MLCPVQLTTPATLAQHENMLEWRTVSETPSSAACSANRDTTHRALIESLHCRCVCWKPVIFHSTNGRAELIMVSSQISCRLLLKIICFAVQLIPRHLVHTLGSVQTITRLHLQAFGLHTVLFSTLQNNSMQHLIRHGVSFEPFLTFWSQ